MTAQDRRHARQQLRAAIARWEAAVRAVDPTEEAAALADLVRCASARTLPIIPCR